MRGFSNNVCTDGAALDDVLTVVSELVLSNNELVLVLCNIREHDLAALEDIDHFPFVNKFLILAGLSAANEGVLSCWVSNFFFLSDCESDLLLAILSELLLDEYGTVFDDVGVLLDHVEGKLELATCG